MRAFPDSVTMRRAVPDDAEALTSLHLDVWEDAYVGLMPDVWAHYVRSAWWGRGVGHALLTATLADRPASLWVLDGSARAMAFHGRHGFLADGTVRTDDHGTELRMVR